MIAYGDTLDRNKFLSVPGYRDSYQFKWNSLAFDLARALNKEDKPDDAITELETLIRSAQEPMTDFFGKKLPIRSYQLGMQILYYGELQNSFKLKGDSTSVDKITKKIARLQEESAKLEKVEAQEEIKRQKKKAENLQNLIE